MVRGTTFRGGSKDPPTFPDHRQRLLSGTAQLLLVRHATDVALQHTLQITPSAQPNQSHADIVISLDILPECAGAGLFQAMWEKFPVTLSQCY